MNKMLRSPAEVKDALEHGYSLVAVKDEDLKQLSGGATAIEYGLISAGISLAIISAVNGLKLPTK